MSRMILTPAMPARGAKVRLDALRLTLEDIGFTCVNIEAGADLTQISVSGVTPSGQDFNEVYDASLGLEGIVASCDGNWERE